MGAWYNENNSGIVVSTRVRLARNLSGMPFPSRMTDQQRKELKEKVKKTTSGALQVRLVLADLVLKFITI